MRDPPVENLDFEVVERKGRGHPDTLCDAIAEEVSWSLTHLYLDRFEDVLHHNVDKVLLRGGAARVWYGGGLVLEPIDIYLAGRATTDVSGVRVDIGELAVEAAKRVLAANLHALDVQRHVQVHPLIRPGSAALVHVHGRGVRPGRLANDTSIGVGFWPPTQLERIVHAVERRLTAPQTVGAFPEIGEDAKVMGLRRGSELALTVSCAAVASHVRSVAEYQAAKERMRSECAAAANELAGREVAIVVNAADDLPAGAAFLTVTGTSGEAGDDGQTGRGNRANGLITPFRPTTLESAAGKNPVSHVGKLYQVLAQRIATALVERLDGCRGAECCLVSRIGRPVEEPEVLEVKLLSVRPRLEGSRPEVERIAREQLDRASSLYLDFLHRRVSVL
ncbi:MAG: methionine adenosyltransferase [Myxococcaceae bacterium]